MPCHAKVTPVVPEGTVSTCSVFSYKNWVNQDMGAVQVNKELAEVEYKVGSTDRLLGIV